MKKNENTISTRLSFFDGTITQILNRGHSKDTKGSYCLLEIKWKDAIFVTDAAYEFRSWLENAGIECDFFGFRQNGLEDFLIDSRNQPSDAIAMVIIYTDRRDFPMVRKLYKQWDLELKNSV